MSNPQAGNAALFGVYDEAFYESQVRESLKSAGVYLGHLFKTYAPKSVVDLGCGRGAWLKACCDLGVEKAVGFDGPWNSQSKMLDERIVFQAVDLDSPIAADQKFDLAISLEVAEHLNAKSAATFVASLAKLSDVVLFGAAIAGQGGTNHINEQYQSYWGELFLKADFDIFDVLRPLYWNEQSVESWYRQNTFLYVKRGHPLAQRLENSGQHKLTSTAFMDCVHPALWQMKIEEIARLNRMYANIGFMRHVRDLGPSFIRGIKSRLMN